MTFEKKIQFSPAYDKRHSDPAKNYGIHGVHIWFALKGEKGAVSFSISTNWHLSHVQSELDAEPLNQFPYMSHKPMPFGVDYHSLFPIREWQKRDVPSQKQCGWLNDKPCWCDGSALAGDEGFRALVERGEEGLWKELEDYYIAEERLRQEVLSLNG